MSRVASVSRHGVLWRASAARVLLVLCVVQQTYIGCGTKEAAPVQGTSSGQIDPSPNSEKKEAASKSQAEAAQPPDVRERVADELAVASARAWDAPYLGDLPQDASFSIGTASRGYLVNGVAMKPRHPCLKIRVSAKNKRAHFGTRALVEGLEQAACAVQRKWPGSELYAGDLSAEAGGDLRGHASHNSGRDADIAFYMRDAAGRMADSTRMLPIRPDGRAKWGGEVVFDLARNWALVEALLKNPRIQVQYLFVANHLRDLLLAHAAQEGVSKDVLSHAKAVLRQPGDSSPHVEHFHLRIYCGLKERLEGCLDYGTIHPWVDTYQRSLAARVGEVLPFLRGGGLEELEFAITRLVRLRAVAAVEHIIPLKQHQVPRVRELAGDAVAFLQGDRTPRKWMHLAEEDAGD
jgi:penicillin-insensitive murein endopeptidase